MKNLGIYIHFPFCTSKCNYCGFYSYAGSNEEDRIKYVDSLVEDIREYGKEYGDRFRVDTIFIGGGTPSIVSAGEIKRVLEAIYSSFKIEESAEITIESNPNSITLEKLKAYKEAGINRLSIGLQSFDDGMLQMLGRVHRKEEFLEAYGAARKVGFHNINVDLIFAMPRHTMEIWENTLEEVTKLEPEHISFYSLQLEEGTPFYEAYRKGEIDLVSDVLDREMYHRAIAFLKSKGYNHYEISNAAIAGYECRHNLKYWQLDDYLGIGAGASSYIEGFRFKEPPGEEFHENTLQDDISEYIFTGLRKTKGINKEAFQKRFGVNIEEIYNFRDGNLKEYMESGLLQNKEGRIFLSEEGIDISNSIMAEFV